MPVAYLGLGCNLGDRRANCLNAIRLLKDKGITVTKESSLYETEPWGYKEQLAFINMAVEIKTDMSPRELLVNLKDIERKMGRIETVRWGPRLIDIDILLYDDLILDEPDLEIPHPLMHKRDFILQPLSEIAPDVIHPVLNKRIRDLL